ncbi:MAG: hypothetical protein J6Q22_13790 [Prevotella sp.]|nr:hypothetical protein [Prevotella sp.]
MIDKLKRIFCKSKTLNEYLAEANLEEKDLQDMTASIDIEGAYLTEAQKSKLASEEGLEFSEDTAHFSGMEIISLSSSAITIISALISLEKWLGSRYSVTITLNGTRQKLSINQAISTILNNVKK